MKAIITNTGKEAVPVVVWRGAAPAPGTAILPAGQSLTIDDVGVGRVDVGEVPTWKEDLAAAAAQASAVLRALIDRVMNRPQPKAAPESMSVSVANNGDEGIRALCGSNLDESEIAAEATAELKAPGATPGSGLWIQLRQLGYEQQLAEPRS